MREQGQNTMRVGCVTLVFLSFVWMANCSPLTCYSRVLGLSKEIMEILDKVHKYQRTKPCGEILSPLFLDVHNSCITTKLRDLLYMLENHPDQSCRERPRIAQLKRKVRNLYVIITRVCYRDLVFFTNDCESLETGYSSPRYGEDRLQLLVER